mmetsp:Transcript_92167/g.269686  ORF Transcript_92167/g.269686 Transcript_92167/m.269686 type:complete len:255 (+) Transcript_92167:1907-2671(+)
MTSSSPSNAQLNPESSSCMQFPLSSSLLRMPFPAHVQKPSETTKLIGSRWKDTVSSFMSWRREPSSNATMRSPVGISWTRANLDFIFGLTSSVSLTSAVPSPRVEMIPPLQPHVHSPSLPHCSCAESNFLGNCTTSTRLLLTLARKPSSNATSSGPSPCSLDTALARAALKAFSFSAAASRASFARASIASAASTASFAEGMESFTWSLRAVTSALRDFACSSVTPCASCSASRRRTPARPSSVKTACCTGPSS